MRCNAKYNVDCTFTCHHCWSPVFYSCSLCPQNDTTHASRVQTACLHAYGCAKLLLKVCVKNSRPIDLPIKSRSKDQSPLEYSCMRTHVSWILAQRVHPGLAVVLEYERVCDLAVHPKRSQKKLRGKHLLVTFEGSRHRIRAFQKICMRRSVWKKFS